MFRQLLEYTVLNKKLPNLYQEVEYIENVQGGEYINTYFIPTNTMKYEIVFEMTVKQNWSFGHLFSAYKSGNRYVTQIRNSEVNNINLICIFRGSSSIVQYQKEINNKIHIISDNNSYIIDNVSHNFDGAFTNIDIPMCLFADKNFSPNSNYALAKVYLLKIWNNDVLVRNFIPCYRKSDSVIGMYDTVGKEFYTNQGTGTFIKGPDV